MKLLKILSTMNETYNQNKGSLKKIGIFSDSPGIIEARSCLQKMIDEIGIKDNHVSYYQSKYSSSTYQDMDIKIAKHMEMIRQLFNAFLPALKKWIPSEEPSATLSVLPFLVKEITNFYVAINFKLSILEMLNIVDSHNMLENLQFLFVEQQLLDDPVQWKACVTGENTQAVYLLEGLYSLKKMNLLENYRGLLESDELAAQCPHHQEELACSLSYLEQHNCLEEKFIEACRQNHFPTSAVLGLIKLRKAGIDTDENISVILHSGSHVHYSTDDWRSLYITSDVDGFPYKVAILLETLCKINPTLINDESRQNINALRISPTRLERLTQLLNHLHAAGIVNQNVVNALLDPQHEFLLVAWTKKGEEDSLVKKITAIPAQQLTLKVWNDILVFSEKGKDFIKECGNYSAYLDFCSKTLHLEQKSIQLLLKINYFTENMIKF